MTTTTYPICETPTPEEQALFTNGNFPALAAMKPFWGKELTPELKAQMFAAVDAAAIARYATHPGDINNMAFLPPGFLFDGQQ